MTVGGVDPYFGRTLDILINMVAFAIRLTLLVCLAYANQAEYEDYMDFRDLMKILAKPRILDRMKHTNSVSGNVYKFAIWSC